MLRVLIPQLILFLLPFFGYFLWLWLSKRSRHPEVWSRGPVGWLTLSGLVLAICGFAFMASVTRSTDGDNYKPAEIRDGVFIPGRFE